ncbi:MAG: ATP-binding protein, partial [Collinsella sp.]
MDDKERAFDFGVTSANSKMKRYIRGTGAGFPMVQEYLENAGGAVSIEDNMGSGTVVTVSLDPKRVQEIERAGGRGAAVRPETEQPTYPLPGASRSSPWQRSRCSPVGQMQHPGMLPTQEPQATSMSMPPNMPETVPLAIRMQQQCSRRRGHRWPANGLSAVPTGISISADAATRVWPAVPQQYQQGYQQPYQQMPQQQYSPWAQQMPPQPYQQWPQSFQQQMPPMQSSQQPAAQMMYPNAANQYAQPQPDVFVSDRGNAALGYLAQNQACGATDLARAFGNSAPTWSRTLND